MINTESASVTTLKRIEKLVYSNSTFFKKKKKAQLPVAINRLKHRQTNRVHIYEMCDLRACCFILKKKNHRNVDYKKSNNVSMV